MLFIVIHQASELWMKLASTSSRPRSITCGVTARPRIQDARAGVAGAGAAHAVLGRAGDDDTLGLFGVSQPTRQILRLPVLSVPDAGVPDRQQDPATIEVYRRTPELYEKLAQALRAPSLYDESLRLLSRRGYEIPADYLDRDWSQPYAASKGVAAAGSPCITTPMSTGICMSWPRSSSISTTSSSSGGSAT